MNPGTRLDHYEIVDKLGEGGMGAVYRACDTSLDREVAVKVLPPSFTADNQSVAFLRRDGDVYAAYRVAVLGGQPRKLIEDVLEVAWSPDSRSLAFLRGSRATGGAALGVLDLDFGQERIVAAFEDRNLAGVSWSDDSRRIVVTKTGTQGASGDFRLVVATVAGDEVREIDVGSRVQGSRALWAGTGALIYAKAYTLVSMASRSCGVPIAAAATRSPPSGSKTSSRDRTRRRPAGSRKAWTRPA